MAPDSADNIQPATDNIEAIARLEEQFQRDRPSRVRLAEWVGDFIGTLRFVVLQLLWFGIWIAVNLGAIPGLAPFDPFPFPLLTVMVSIEGVLLATFILIKQNWMSRRADRRSHLALQVTLLSEREATMALHLLERIARRLGCDVKDSDMQDLKQATALEALARELEAKLPDS